VDDDPGETIRYMTGGVLLRVNRLTQELEPELATAWKIRSDGREIEFQLRDGVKYSDGTPFSPEDVVFTMRTLMDPAVHSPTGDAFRGSPGDVPARVLPGNRVSITFPRPMAGLVRLFDQVAILNPTALSRTARPAEMPVLGPFQVAEYRPGDFVRLRRNPYYWKSDAAGARLPYLDSVRLLIQPNRDIEMLRFLGGELDAINAVDAEAFERLSRSRPAAAVDRGPSLESEQIWFNQAPSAPIPSYKKQWFESSEFRRAISAAIHRQDICRLVYRGRAAPAVGPISPANRLWVNATLAPLACDPAAALRSLAAAGFRRENGALRDRDWHPVEFSLITNSGNKMRERVAAMVQQDLAAIGIRLNVVALDFTSLLERVSRSFQYEACLLGLINIDPDPNGQMNIWLSSAENHQWNPRQRKPCTPWEAEIDRLMLAQATEIRTARRKALFDRVQEIVREEAPFLYLVHPHALCAISPRLRNAAPAVLRPQAWWNIDRLYLAPDGAH
jgi:peptide/nickel transport system substrate-binding protein